MCRWLGYTGEPIHLETLVFRPEHSLIHQSLSARSGETTNGDGFGIGWYGDRPEPGAFKDVRPAWNDPNLRDLCHQIRSRLFLAHVRSASPGLAIQRSNCHPFRYANWLLVHNGRLHGFPALRRRMLAEIPDELFHEIEGTTDSELLFFLALAHGLREDPIGALERAVGRVEEIGREVGVEHPVTMTLGLGDGHSLWGVRYSSDGRSRTLYCSDRVEALAKVHPEARALDPNARALVSEPLTDLDTGWIPLEEGTAVRITDGRVEAMAFTPGVDGRR